jgi:NitT/TauT family transport system ATP-binding protein
LAISSRAETFVYFASVGLEKLYLLSLGAEILRRNGPLHFGQRSGVGSFMPCIVALRPRLLLMDEPFAALDAIVRHRIAQDLLDLVEGEKISVLLVTHDLGEALVLSDVVYLLAQGPRARIRQRYVVPTTRPRDIMKARTNPSFAPLLERLWLDLSA